MVNDKDINNALDFAAKYLAADCGGHDMEHVLRVIDNAKLIIAQDDLKDIDENLVYLACALHDVDDKKLKPSGEPEYSRLREFCDAYNYSDALFNSLRYIIDHIAFSKNIDRDPSLSIEAQVAQDADRLDALGAIGIARAFAYGGRAGRPFFGDGSTVAHFHEKLFKLPELMNTETARSIALERVRYMRDFLKLLDER